MCVSVFDGMSVYTIDRYKNIIPRAMPLHMWKHVQPQKRFTHMTHDSIGRLKTLYMSILSLSGGVESEWKRCSSPISDDKTLSIH